MSEHTLQKYQEAFSDVIVETREHAGELTIEIKPEALVDVSNTLKSMFGFTYLSDLTGVDYYTDENRFGVSYNLVNIESKKRLRLTARIADEETPTIDTVSGVWTAAMWFEREAWDMLGIRFKGHPDHRRVFMPEDFEYHPLRKEFPLIGIPGSIETPPPAPPKEYS